MTDTHNRTDAQNQRAMRAKVAHDNRRDLRTELSEERSTSIRTAIGKPKLTDDQIDDILERISNGEFITDACSRHGVTHGALYHRARSDEEFAVRFNNAREEHYLTLAENTRLVARGVEGYSSGCVTRDALIVKTDMTLAKAFADVLADRMQHRVEHSIAPVMLPSSGIFAPMIEGEFDAVEDGAGDD